MLHEATLVLNRNWVPIDVTTVRHALVLVYQDVARVVNPEDYSTHDFSSWVALEIDAAVPCVRTVSLRVPLPEVIVLSFYAGYPHKSAAFTRRNLLKRDNYSCQYCGAEPGVDKLTIDHVLPRSRGGISSWENCVVACPTCNKRKGGCTPEEAGLRLRRRPFRPVWSPRLVLGRTRQKASWEKFVNHESAESKRAAAG
ncbi:MAG: HNH endonuclease [Planctomycetota bacterium]